MEGLDFSCTRGLFLAYDLQQEYKKKQEEVGNYHSFSFTDASMLDDFIVQLFYLENYKEELKAAYEDAVNMKLTCK